MKAKIDPENNEMTPLMVLASKGEVQSILHLLATGVDVDATDKRGGTALMYAAMNKHAAVVKLLLEVGASPVLKTNKGLSAIDFAIRSRSNEVMQSISEFVAKSPADYSEVRIRLSKYLWDSVVKWATFAFVVGFLTAHHPEQAFVDSLALRVFSGFSFSLVFGFGRWLYLK